MDSKCAWGSEIALTMDGTHETRARTAGEKEKEQTPRGRSSFRGAALRCRGALESFALQF